MFKFSLVIRILTLQFRNISFDLSELVLFVRDIESFLVCNTLEIINLSKIFADIIFKRSNLSGHLNTLFSLGVILKVEFINFI